MNDEEFISAVAEPARDAHAQKTNPKLKAPPRTFSILLPDLLVESVEADPTGKVKEDVEFNNWMESNPNRAPFPPDGTTYCKPKS